MANHESREIALGRAIQHHGGEGDADKIVETAAAFAEFLDPSPGGIDEEQVRAWINHSSENAERAVRIATNYSGSVVAALEGEWGTLGAVCRIVEDLDEGQRVAVLTRAQRPVEELYDPLSPGSTFES